MSANRLTEYHTTQNLSQVGCEPAIFGLQEKHLYPQTTMGGLILEIRELYIVQQLQLPFNPISPGVHCFALVYIY